MATILEDVEVQFEWVDPDRWQQPTPRGGEHLRTPGVHLTDILRYLHFGSMPILAAKEQEIKRIEWDLDASSIMPLRMVIGQAFEYFFAGFYPDMLWQPGQFEVDGVCGNPDGYSFVEHPDSDPRRKHPDVSMAVEEFKFTWKSCRTREVLKESLWMWQLKGYCYMLGAELGRMHVCWSNGDYNHPYQPRYRRTLIRFTPDELKRNWDMIVAARDQSIVWNRDNNKERR